MPHTLSCTCGTMEWQISETAKGSQIICYCRDCQTEANHLNRADLLHQGGTYIYQTTPDAVTITKGEENLALMRLSPNGLMRYYASCCGSPVANTLKNNKLPFVGLPLANEDARFGPLICHAFPDQGTSGRKQSGFAAAGWGILIRGLTATLTGRRTSPFFTEAGEPVRDPQTLTKEERRNAAPNR